MFDIAFRGILLSSFVSWLWTILDVDAENRGRCHRRRFEFGLSVCGSHMGLADLDRFSRHKRESWIGIVGPGRSSWIASSMRWRLPEVDRGGSDQWGQNKGDIGWTRIEGRLLLLR